MARMPFALAGRSRQGTTQVVKEANIDHSTHPLFVRLRLIASVQAPSAYRNEKEPEYVYYSSSLASRLPRAEISRLIKNKRAQSYDLVGTSNAPLPNLTNYAPSNLSYFPKRSTNSTIARQDCGQKHLPPSPAFRT